MLENHPILRDRLKACGVFSGIAIAAVAGFDLVITGSFDFLTPGGEIRQVAPSAYVQVIDTPWAGQTRFVALSSNEPMFAGETVYGANEHLAGGYDDASAPDGGYPQARNEDDLYTQIEALYAREGAQEYQVEEVADDADEDAAFDDSDPLNDKSDVSADESALPW